MMTVAQFRAALRGDPHTVFLVEDGTALCHACVSRERRRIIEAMLDPRGDPAWRVASHDATYNTRGPVVCDECHTVLQDDDAPTREDQREAHGDALFHRDR